MPLDVIETLCDLVRLPSVNPMGRDVSGDEYFEYQVTDYLERLFDRLGLPWRRQTIEPRRDNIVARLDGDVPPQDGGAILMFEAHQDTVPVDGMTIPPWTPTIRDGRVYGRGACDIKGGMACMLTALSRLAEERPRGRPTIVMACSVNEEHGFGGAPRMHELWEDGSGFLPRAPDAVIVAEPTLLDVVVAHKGAVRWRCHARGRAGHSSQPHLGDNAIYRMARVLEALERYARDVAPTLGRHPLVGHPTLSVGLISGGVSVNTVPDCCTIEIDRRVLPDEDPQAALRTRHVVRGPSGRPRSAGGTRTAVPHLQRPVGRLEPGFRRSFERYDSPARGARPLPGRALRDRCSCVLDAGDSHGRVRPRLDRPGTYGGRVGRHRSIARGDRDSVRVCVRPVAADRRP